MPGRHGDLSIVTSIRLGCAHLSAGPRLLRE